MWPDMEISWGYNLNWDLKDLNKLGKQGVAGYLSEVVCSGSLISSIMQDNL